MVVNLGVNVKFEQCSYWMVNLLQNVTILNSYAAIITIFYI